MLSSKRRNKLILNGFIFLIFATIVFASRYEIVAFHPFYGDKEGDIKVLTWNIHCSNGADIKRQQKIANLILRQNADFILLNEFYQDSCRVIDSLLRVHYSYTEEYQSHHISGDIFYCNSKMFNSGHQFMSKLKIFQNNEGKTTMPDSLRPKTIQAIKATISIESDSIEIVGLHWKSNRGNKDIPVSGLSKLVSISELYKSYKKAQQDRCFQASWTKIMVEEAEHPIIIMGDMNDFSCSEPLDIFASCGLRDSWCEGGFGYGTTFHSGWYRLRIDHIMHSEDLKLTSIKVITTDLSDHNPMVASFKLN